MNINAIVSVDRAENSPEVNERNRYIFEREVKHFYRLTGVYKGTEERSYLIESKDQALKFARGSNQDCFLERGHKDMWYLIDTETNTPIGYFPKGIVEVPVEQALKSEYYSVLTIHDLSTNRVNTQYFMGKLVLFNKG